MQLGCEAADASSVNNKWETLVENSDDNYRGSTPDIAKDVHCSSPEDPLDDHNVERESSADIPFTRS